MRYIDMKNYFSAKNRHVPFLEHCISHVNDLNSAIQGNGDLFILLDKFSTNEDLEFYIELNDFFNQHKPCNHSSDAKDLVKILLSIAACAIPLMKNIDNIDKSFFIIYSAIDYELDFKINRIEGSNIVQATIDLLILETNNLLPNRIGNHLFIYFTYIVVYAKKHSTDYDVVNSLIHYIRTVPNLLESISKEENINFLIQLLEWCNDNQHSDTEIFYSIVNDLGKKTKDEEIYLYTELCLFRFRETYEKEYNYSELIEFYEKNAEKINFIDKLRILTQLFLKVDRDKYLNLFSEEITKVDARDLIDKIESKHPKTFSAYIINLSFYKNEDFLNFLHTNYGCSKEVLETTAFYIHADDATYILEKSLSKIDISDADLHFNIISYMNEIYSLGITVFGESINQKKHGIYKPEREHVPTDTLTKIDAKLIKSIEEYYCIDKIELSENIKFILPFQHIRLPLQQILLKKYNKLFPIVKVFNKEDIIEKEIEHVIHIALSESTTLDQERETIEYLNSLTEDIYFEYKYITDPQELLEVLSSDSYSVISITSHGEIDIREPLNNKIKIGEEYFILADFEPKTYNLNKKRLLYLNICDSGHFTLKNGFLLESLSTQLTNNNQATISNMWPVGQLYSSTFLMIFLHHLISVNSFKEAYKLTLSLAVENELDLYISRNNLIDIEIFKIFKNSSLNKKSIVNWGSLLYQE